MCPHSNIGSPASCSQCIGAAARLVRSDQRGVTVDGVQVRAGIIAGTEAPQSAEPPGQVEPMPMTPDQVADLVRRVRAADEAERETEEEKRAAYDAAHGRSLDAAREVIRKRIEQRRQRRT